MFSAAPLSTSQRETRGVDGPRRPAVPTLQRLLRRLQSVRGLRGSALYLLDSLFRIADQSRGDSLAWTQARLAEALRVSVKTVGRLLNTLQSAGLIRRTRRSTPAGRLPDVVRVLALDEVRKLHAGFERQRLAELAAQSPPLEPTRPAAPQTPAAAPAERPRAQGPRTGDVAPLGALGLPYLYRQPDTLTGSTSAFLPPSARALPGSSSKARGAEPTRSPGASEPPRSGPLPSRGPRASLEEARAAVAWARTERGVDPRTIAREASRRGQTPEALLGSDPRSGPQRAPWQPPTLPPDATALDALRAILGALAVPSREPATLAPGHTPAHPSGANSRGRVEKPQRFSALVGSSARHRRPIEILTAPRQRPRRPRVSLGRALRALAPWRLVARLAPAAGPARIELAAPPVGLATRRPSRVPRPRPTPRARGPPRPPRERRPRPRSNRSRAPRSP